jgi:hypothetical protein
MRELKGNIVSLLSTTNIDRQTLVKIANICDNFQSRLDNAEAKDPSSNTGSQKSICDNCSNSCCLVRERFPFSYIMAKCSGHK